MENVILKIAYRNLWKHKIKTFIIGILVALGILILVVGNSLMDSAAAGLRKAYIENFTGDLIITSGAMKNPSMFMDGVMSEPDSPLPIIPDEPKIEEYLSGLKGVNAFNPQISGAVSIKHEDDQGFTLIFSFDPARYREVFQDNIELIEGEFLKKGEEGLILSEDTIKRMRDFGGKEIKVNDKVLLTKINSITGTKIREVTVRGIFRFKNDSPQLRIISFLDVDNMRIINGMLKNTNIATDLTAEEKSLLGQVDENSLFGETDGLDGLVESPDSVSSSPSDYLSILGDTSKLELYRETDPAAWNYIVVKLDPEVRSAKVIKQLNKWFAEQGIDAKAYSWLSGAGAIAKMSNTLKIVFNLLIFIVAVVGVIIIMNTLVISVTERIGEIGTMRAIGAKKSFIRKMIMMETLMITVIFGLIGAFTGIVITWITGAVGFTATNEFLQVIMGGKVFHPVVSVKAVFMSLFIVGGIGIFASLYPVAVALKISPVKAMGEN